MDNKILQMHQVAIEDTALDASAETDPVTGFTNGLRNSTKQMVDLRKATGIYDWEK